MRERRCILVTEDEPLLAVELSTFLDDNDYDVAGPYPSVAATLNELPGLAIDGAVLDLNLRGEMALPIMERLSAAGIPFLFLTGHSRSHVPERYRDRPFLNKPLDRVELLRILKFIVPVPSSPAPHRAG